MQASEIFILSAQRTAIGTFGGALKDVPLGDLATTAVKAALLNSQVDPERIGHVVMGNVIPPSPRTPIWRGLRRSMRGFPRKHRPITSIACAAPVCRQLFQPPIP